MSLPTSRLAYPDCLDAMDAALKDPKGIRVKVADQDAAYVFRQRLHQARTLDRENNKLAYEPGHAMYGCSIYDELRCSIKKTKSGWFIYIETVKLSQDSVENLSEVTEEVETAPVATPEALAAAVEYAKRRV